MHVTLQALTLIEYALFISMFTLPIVATVAAFAFYFMTRVNLEEKYGPSLIPVPIWSLQRKMRQAYTQS